MTEDQILDLYAFTRRHYVVYYDLQTELVDHLANDIELIRNEKPKLSFEEARQIAFKKFGIFGFTEIVEQRQKAMNKRYWKYIWNELKQWFSLPKIVFTSALCFAFYMMFSSNLSHYFFVSFYIILIGWAIVKTISLNRQFRSRREQTDKKWMLEDIIFSQATGLNLVFISQLYTVVKFSENLSENQYWIMTFSILFTAAILFFHISYHILPSKAEQLLKSTYPEYAV